MVKTMVEQATSSMLIGPDWGINLEICDMLNHDPGQVKDVIKAVKKRLGNKTPKVQLLALTLLETIMKNCGDFVHMHVAEKDILHDMVRIAKKKPDFHVKEKILILIDTWQEAFGGPRSGYPQYYAAYQELLRAGAVFPERSESSAPVLTPPQTQPLSSYPPNVRSSDRHDTAEPSAAEAEFSVLSLTEMQNARGIMDVLSEMLNALNPGNKEGLKQEVIVDLVEQCRTYKQRVVHLVNTTSDESLLAQGLALNDDLERVLAKHEAIAAGTSVQRDKFKTENAGHHVDVGRPLADTTDRGKQPDVSTSSSAETGSTLNQLLLPAPPSSNGAVPPARVDPIDLLSGDDYNSPKAENSLALVLSGGLQPTEQNALVLIDMFSDMNDATSPAGLQTVNGAGQSNPSTSQSQQPHSNGIVDSASSQYEHSQPAWNGQIIQQQQPLSPVYGTENNAALPPPPWEDQSSDSGPASVHYPEPTQATQVLIPNPPLMQPSMGGMYIQPVTGVQVQQPAINSYAIQGNQFGGFHPQQMQGMQYGGMVPQPYQFGPMTPMYPQPMYGNQMAGYGYGQPLGTQVLDQRMSGLSIGGDVGYKGSSTPSYVHPSKPSKPEDKLFGDLVDINKFKSTKAGPGKAGST